MIRPDRGLYGIGQRFGENPFKLGYGADGHTGVDLLTPVGAVLVAGVSGTVTRADSHPVYGLRVVVSDGRYNVYVGHMSRIDVKVGDRVTEGQQIGLSGATGTVTGPHTHWEVTEETKAGRTSVDPLSLIKEGEAMDYKKMWENAHNIAESRLKQIRTAEAQIEDFRTRWDNAHRIAEERLAGIEALQKEKAALEAQVKDLGRIAAALEKIANK